MKLSQIVLGPFYKNLTKKLPSRNSSLFLLAGNYIEELHPCKKKLCSMLTLKVDLHIFSLIKKDRESTFLVINYRNCRN